MSEQDEEAEEGGTEGLRDSLANGRVYFGDELLTFYLSIHN